MRRTFWGVAVVLSAVALTLGCGGGGASIPLDQFGNEFAAIYCHKMFTCCDAREITSIDANAVDEATCRSHLAGNVRIAPLPSEVDAGRVLYHGDRARGCLDTLTALPCQQWVADDALTRFPICATIVEGTLVTGSACVTSDECSGGYCGNNTGTFVCAAPAQLGQSCEFARCVLGLACLTNQSGAPRMCGQPLPDGASCFSAEECASTYCITDGTGLAFCGLPMTCDGI
jgi:hypothetical protein